jgi:hypothetical protein
MTDTPLPKNTPEPNAPHQGFDYCFWSKLLVALVLFPLIGAIAVFLFSNIFAKIAAAALAISLIIYAAIKIDQMPCFAGKIPPLIGKGGRN